MFIRVPFPNERLYRPLIVVGVLGASGLLAYHLSPGQAQRVLMLLLGGGMALVFLRWPPLGLVALIVASLVVPFAIGTGTQTALNVTVLLLPMLLTLWVFDMVARQRRIALLPSRPIRPLLALSLVAVLAFIAGNQPWIVFAQTAPLRAQLGGLAVFLLSAGAFLLVAHQVQDLRWLERLTWLFLALGGLYIAGRVVPGLGRYVLRFFQHGATGSLFWTWLVALSFSQAVFNRQLHMAWRLALGGLMLATLYVGLFLARSWASGWLPPLVAVVVVLGASTPRLGLLATTTAGMAIMSNAQKIISQIMVGDQQYSLATRLEAWRILAKIVKVNLVLGLGPANYYWYTPLFPILGWYVNFNSHNQYVDLMAQTGLLGLLCFLWFAWEVGRLGWRLRTKVPDGFAQAYVYGALGGLAGTLVAGMLGDWVLPFVYNIKLDGMRASVLGWLFLGGLIVLEKTFVMQTAEGMPEGEDE
ncbi:MAG: O-antigen ligase domain-containing protein [Chloroflexi bacterium]|nr:MAG: O-antigen ligase domain-containing protein [Chloroflexota bacterium]